MATRKNVRIKNFWLDLHEWPNGIQKFHILQRDCMCNPVVKKDGKSSKSFLVIHKELDSAT